MEICLECCGTCIQHAGCSLWLAGSGSGKTTKTPELEEFLTEQYKIQKSMIKQGYERSYVYRHQYAYAKTEAGKAARKKYCQTEKGKIRARIARAKYREKKRNLLADGPRAI